MAQHKQGHGTSRQPQGNFGRGRDHAALGSSDDANRHLNKAGAYRGAETPQEDDKDDDFGVYGRDFGFGQTDPKVNPGKGPKTPGKR